MSQIKISNRKRNIPANIKRESLKINKEKPKHRELVEISKKGPF